MKTLMLASTIAISSIPSFASIGFENNDTPDSLNESSQLTINIIDIQHPSCVGGADGSIQIKAQGGTAPYEYNWNTFPNQYTETATELTAGIYFIHITDAKGNKFYRPVELRDGSENRTLNHSINDYTPESALKAVELVTAISPEPCVVKLDGAVVKSFQPYDLTPGIYKVEIIDAIGCITKRFVQVYEYEKVDEPAVETMPLATNHAVILSK